jgi:hypothetical protein
MDALSGAVMRLAGSFNGQEIANTIWAYAVLQEKPPNTLIHCIFAIAEEIDDDLALTQISYATLAGEVLDWPRLPDELTARAQQTQRKIVQSGVNASKVQERVFSCLQSMGRSDAKFEAAMDDGLFSIDIILPGIAVEIDGPSHFTSSRGLNGSTLLRNFLLEWRYGLRVVSLPYFEIDGNRDHESLKAYLSSKLQVSTI